MKHSLTLLVALTAMNSYANNIPEVLGYQAERVSLYVGGWSHHLTERDNGEDFNESHNMFALEVDNYVIGTFKNSFGDQTYAVGYNYSWEYQDFEYGVLAGVSYGYKEKYMDDSKTFLNYNGWMPLVVPYVNYNLYEDNDVSIKPQLMLLGSAVAVTIRVDF